MSDVATQSREPSLRFMLSHPAHVISLGFGAGLAPFAPGTFGTLLGLFAARWLQPLLGDTLFFAALFGALLIGTWAAGVTGRALGESDHGAIVWDEVIAMALITAMLPGAMWKQASATYARSSSVAGSGGVVAGNASEAHATDTGNAKIGRAHV